MVEHSYLIKPSSPLFLRKNSQTCSPKRFLDWRNTGKRTEIFNSFLWKRFERNLENFSLLEKKDLYRKCNLYSRFKHRCRKNYFEKRDSALRSKQTRCHCQNYHHQTSLLTENAYPPWYVSEHGLDGGLYKAFQWTFGELSKKEITWKFELNVTWISPCIFPYQFPENNIFNSLTINSILSLL